MRPTVLGVYDSYANARSAQRALGEAGIAQADIAIYSISVDAPREKGPRVYVQGAVDTHHHKKVFDRLEQLFAHIFTRGEYPTDAEDYREFIRRGGTVVSADVTESQVDLAIETMLRMGAADIEEHANAWRTGTAKVQGPEHAAHPGSAMTGEHARQQEATHGRQGDTPAASAVRPAPSPGTPAAARTDVHGAAFSVADTNAAAGMQQVSTRTDGRGSTPPVEKQPHASGASEAGFAGTNTDAGVKAHSAQSADGKSAASNAQRQSGTGFMGDPGLGTQQGDAYPYDSEFRKDYDAHYANTGGSYDEYRRAYSHGATLGRDERYRGADWQGVEASARANWESRYPESGWERFKTAVKHGWERVRRGG
ncbi:hypothetical protein M3I54_08800 [Paraburkholderia sp. CNPSo 3274]|uniref:hypothetical protein n=1 Tax=Paraburkholderia sp. CNPSo 3274 TaxID=2940932 RepID=UPI0020B7F773|nr:hypothetical protein [Paraburkholderia sp. CNPSo 3274]MCP3707081.1 hypothetical protein [Paraburkholderia sp. CNPSo 3274]